MNWNRKMNWVFTGLAALLLSVSSPLGLCAAQETTNNVVPEVASFPAASNDVATTSTNSTNTSTSDFTSSPGSERKKVVRVPIDDQITSVTLYMVREGVALAKSSNADALLIEMDTPGGRVDFTEDIIRTLAGLEIPVITFITNDAHSAGSLIAMCTDKVYMRPLTRIGDSIAILPTRDGVATLDAHTREKVTAPIDTFARMYSKRVGRNPDIVSAMIRPERLLAFPASETQTNLLTVVPEGEILELDNEGAGTSYWIDGKMQPLISLATLETVEEVLAAEGLAGAELLDLEVTWAHHLARYIVLLSPLLGIAGFLLIQEEIRAPGFGIMGILGIGCFLILFYGHNVAGLAGYEEVVLFMLGVVLIGLEVFVFPGFGIAGIGGIACVLASLFMAMVKYMPNLPDAPDGFGIGRIANLETASINTTIVLLGTMILGILSFALLPRTRFFSSRLELAAATSADQGYVIGPESGLALEVGALGTTITELRPSGMIEVAGQLIDVVSTGGFIDPGTPVRVVYARGNRVEVEASSSTTITTQDSNV